MCKRVWKYCRVSNYTDRYLLNYQKEILLGVAKEVDFYIVGISKEIGKRAKPFSTDFNTIRTHIYKNDLGFVLIYEKTKLSIYRDLYMDFQMFCEHRQISIIDLQEFKVLIVVELVICL
ncbi:hypothetical protein IMSAGC017_02377 [Thomasclavelia cocleata]|uniref:Resolvase, N terminal domain n=1 Tax=Thomasclavelia cocleata TaxID=69824 RepID=A0A829ZDU3_9FIRM|nr:hypothetical protein [Thomasclavelia cocleata]GFI42329.1 hypothetical protein IMSAGC017_02377 [Thomasclavelia cocleata]